LLYFQAEGVRYLIETTVAAAEGVPVIVWQTSGEFVKATIGAEFPELTAAANWHALATWAARSLGQDETGLLIDVGSTTTDIVPLADKLPVPRGLNDFERLQSGELIYTGGKRTPVCSVLSQVNVNGVATGISSELFAKMQDVYLILGLIEEEPTDLDTADCRPADARHARQRLARMLCVDAPDLGDATIHDIARQIRDAQLKQIGQGLRQVLGRMKSEPQQVILSGSSEFLAKFIDEQTPELARAKTLSVSTMLGRPLSTAACAYALCQLATERYL